MSGPERTAREESQPGLAVLAEAAGLGATLAAFPADVEAAAADAARFRNEMKPPSNPTAEPWPPMRVPGSG